MAILSETILDAIRRADRGAWRDFSDRVLPALTVRDTRAAVATARIDDAGDGILFLRTAGYSSVGDEGGARYKWVAAQPSHDGWVQSSDGAYWELDEPQWTPAMLGADITGTNDSKAAFDSALRANAILRLPAGHVYKIDGELTLPDFCHIVGDAGVGSADGTSAEATPKLVFTGSNAGSSCIVSDSGSALSYSGITNVAIRVEGTYDWVFDLVRCVACRFVDVRVNVTGTSTGGFRSDDGGTTPTWVQQVRNLQIRIPDASTKRTLDIDWSDSSIVGGNFTGGIGAIIRGTGAVACLGVRFDRAQGAAGAAALTIEKETESPASNIISGCEFEESDVGVLVNTSVGGGAGGITDDRIMPIITGCHFRNPSGTDIKLTNTSGNALRGPIIGRNIHTLGGGLGTVADRLDYTPSQWEEFDAPPSRITHRDWTAVSHTGDTTSTTLKTAVIQGRAMGAYGGLRIMAVYTNTGSAAIKTAQILAGATLIGSMQFSTTQKTGRIYVEFWNRGSVSSQVANSSTWSGIGVDDGTIITATVNTDADFNILLKGQLGNSGDTVQIEGYWIELIPG